MLLVRKFSVALCLTVFPYGILLANAQPCSMTSPCRLEGGKLPLVQPRHIRTKNGFMHLNLTVEVAELKVNWLTLRRRSYNREIPGPTWMIKPGDTFNLTLTNKLEEPEFVSKHNTFQTPNHTNIHTHGLHISGLRPHDNVFVDIPPNGTYNYNYPIVSDHPSGTYWYHPHWHGSVDFQVFSGMSGMIIVEDPTNSSTPQHIQDVSCPNNCEHDVQLVFQSLLFYSGYGFSGVQKAIKDKLPRLDMINITHPKHETLINWMEDKANGVNNFTTNGRLNPVMNLTTGQIKRFRMVNAGVRTTLELFIADENNATACDFYEIAIDGVYLDKAERPRFGKSFVVASAKVDWLVVCDKAGTYFLKSYAPDFEKTSIGENGGYNGTLLTIRVTGQTTSTTIKTELPKRPFFIKDFRNLPQDKVHGRFVIEVGSGLTLNRDWFRSEDFWRYNVEVNTVQEWYFTNTGTSSSHPIHIHVNSFQVISYNPYTGPFDHSSKKYWSQNMEPCDYQHYAYNKTLNVSIPNDPLKYLGHDKRWKNGKGGPETIGLSQPGVFRDVILVPPLSNITIRFMTNKFLGDVVIHCHILGHEDFGMMMTARILEQGADLNHNVSVKSGNAFPGTCKKCDRFPFNGKPLCDTSSKAMPMSISFGLLYPIFFSSILSLF